MLTWLAFWFAFRSKREDMWRHCAIVGVIAGILTACWDWSTFHSEWQIRLHPEYAIAANNGRLMATMVLLDFLWAFGAVLSICWFGWICRWLFIWRKQKEHPHPPITPLVRSLWRFGDFGWRLVVIIATPILLLIIGAVVYEFVLPSILEKSVTSFPSTPHYQTVPTATPFGGGRSTAAIDLPTETPEVRRALPVPTPEVRRALPGDPSFHDGHWFHLGKNGKRTQEVPTSVTIQDGKWFHGAPAHSKTSDGISVGSYTRDKYGNYIEF
jgi:hypothetical protein